MSWHTLLVLGGAGSGRSEFAESMVGGLAGLRRVGGPAAAGGDLAGLLSDAKPDESLLVEDLAAWLPTPGAPDLPALLQAVRACPARLVLVSPEAGLAAGVADDRVRVLGEVNHAIAEAVDAVVLTIAGQPVWLKGAGTPAGAGPARATTAPAPSPAEAAPDLSNLKTLPSLDEDAKAAATAHLARLGTARLGALAAIVTFAAGTQGTAPPAPWRNVRVLVLHGAHTGAAGAGPAEAAQRVAQLRAGSSPLAQLAGAAGAHVQLVEVAAAAPIEEGPALTDEQAEQALGYGWRLADQAADEGVDALVLGSVGDGADTAAAAVVSILATNAEPAALLARVATPDGKIDDNAWIQRCAAVRDAVRRVRAAGRTGARPVLAEVGGPDIATATGLVLGAAARRTPVLVDGPVGAAAVLAARGLAAPARHWCLLPDHNAHPTVVRVSETLSYTPLLDLRLELGEGAAALAALPLLRSALTLAAPI